MLNKDKDEYIKTKLKKDKNISSEVNEVFKNCDCFKLATISKTMLCISIVFIVGLISISKFKTYGKSDIKEDFKEDIQVNLASNIQNNESEKERSNVLIKNNLIDIDENNIKFSSENELIKAFVTNENKVAIQLKNMFINLYNLNLQEDLKYEVTGFNKEIKGIFSGYIDKVNYPYVFLLMQDGTVEYIQIISGGITVSDNYEFHFYGQGQILGLTDIDGFEQERESKENSKAIYYYVNAIKSDGTKKRIEIGTYNDMSTVSKNVKIFKSNDGTKEFSVNVDEGNYIQLSSIQNMVYYMNDNCLFSLNLTNGSNSKLVTGITKIWSEDSDKVIVLLKDTNTIHENDDNVIFCQSDVTDSNIVDIQEDSSIIAMLKEDGSITIQFKKNGISKITNDQTYLKEGIRYNVYTMGYGEQINGEGSYYANAKSIALGRIGLDQKLCLIYLTNDDKVISIDIEKALEKGLFKAPDAVYNISTVSKTVSKIMLKNINVVLSDRSKKSFNTCLAIDSDGRETDILISVIMNNIENYEIVN